MPSYEKINYLLRPNKFVERKMVCELLSKVLRVEDITNYHYIGFGSTYFVDFSLFHRELGITNMISIEKDDTVEDRCEFNKPFGCIKLMIGDSSTILPNIELDKIKSIIWLDYDYAIRDFMFSDIRTVISSMMPMSFFMLTININLKEFSDDIPKDDDDRNKKIRNNIINAIGKDRFPDEYDDKRMTPAVFSQLMYDSIIQEINSVVNTRNKDKSRPNVIFHQTIYFQYEDGAKMMTLGGFLLNKEEAENVITTMGIQNLPYYRHGKEAYTIECPILSIKEIMGLNALIPPKNKKPNGNYDDKKFNRFPLPYDAKLKYLDLYRYFPHFTETII